MAETLEIQKDVYVLCVSERAITGGFQIRCDICSGITVSQIKIHLRWY